MKRTNPIDNVRRLVVRSAFGQAYYPISRFQRIEGNLRVANVDDAVLSILEPYNPFSGFATEDPTLETNNLPGVTYFQPSVALVFDNSLFGYTGPFFGRRWRLDFAQTIGDWRYFPGHRRLPPVRQNRRAGYSRPPPVLLRPDWPRFRPLPDLRRQHRSYPRQHLWLVPSARVPQFQRREHSDRVRSARSAGR